MTAPVRVQLSRAKGWRMPPDTVKVDRSTRWGNPFRVDCRGDALAAAEAVHQFRARVIGFESNGSFCKPLAHPESYLGRIIADIGQLRGKNLACWCKPGTPCHADVLLELANR